MTEKMLSLTIRGGDMARRLERGLAALAIVLVFLVAGVAMVHFMIPIDAPPPETNYLVP